MIGWGTSGRGRTGRGGGFKIYSKDFNQLNGHQINLMSSPKQAHDSLKIRAVLVTNKMSRPEYLS